MLSLQQKMIADPNSHSPAEVWSHNVAQTEEEVRRYCSEWIPYEEEDEDAWMPFKPDTTDDRSLGPLIKTPIQ